MKSLLLLGSTGSIGTQTLDVLRAEPEGWRVVGLAAQSSAEALLAQIREFAPRYAALVSQAAADELRPRLPAGVQLFGGPHALRELIEAARCDVAVHGVVGAAGVEASLQLLARGVPLALANKESLVIAGQLMVEASRRSGAPILPIDSEHCAILQCLAGARIEDVRCIWLTASGGPLRDLPLDALAEVTPERALAHPNWSMGKRISIGSATLMNKALEVIEGHHLFGLEAARIRVLLHRQSVVHSMVEFVDGSVLAQMGPPDMRGPIHYALHHPRRAPSKLRGFDATLFKRLDFEEVDARRFPALELGYACIERGGDSGAALNAADEVAVAAYLEGAIRFTDMHDIQRASLAQPARAAQALGELLESDARARDQARLHVARIAAASAR